MPQASKTFRIFVSSAFSDLKSERNALQQYVFPMLRELCRRNGCGFQAVDLRWGVRDEAALDQQTMKICLEEVYRCQKSSPRPNFIVLLGDRYGWQPLPAEIPEREFQQIQSQVSDSDDLKLLLDWYKADLNAVFTGDDDPPQSLYCLQPRMGLFVDFKTWEKVELQLRSIFAQAIEKLRLSADEKRKYSTSATEQEILAGAFQVVDAREHVFGFFREITNLKELISSLPDNEAARDFVDTDGTHHFDPAAHDKLDSLKKELKTELGENVSSYEAKWDRDHISLDHIGTLPATLEECLKLNDAPALQPTLCVDVWKQLSLIILKEISKLKSIDPLQREIEEHRDFARDRRADFRGRVTLLRAIEDHCRQRNSQALVITGASGSGKSAVMAQAIADCQSAFPDAVFVYRFIGATPESSDGRALLEGISRQTALAYDAAPPDVPGDYKALVATVEGTLKLATTERPLVIFLDALDQLATGDQVRNLLWLPGELPPNVSVVLSTLEGDSFDILQRKLPPKNILRIDDMTVDEGAELLGLWLKGAKRTLRPDQRGEVLEKFGDCPLPLYLKLAFEEVRRWHSYDSSPPLKKNIEEMIQALFQRLADDSNHGKTLVAYSLGYLAAAKNGISEDELLDVLSRSYTVFKEFLKRAHHRPPERRLPVIVWSRLYFDLEPYLTERRADGSTLLGFYHRQLTTVAKNMYLKGMQGTESHRSLARYFALRSLYVQASEKLPDLRKLSELPFQQTHGRLWDELPDTLCNLQFLHAKSNAGRVFDAINDYVLAQSLLAQDGSAPGHTKELIDLFASAFNQEFHAFQQRPGTTSQQIFNNIYVEGIQSTAAESRLQQFLAEGDFPNGPWLRRSNVAPGTSTSRALLRTLAAHDGPVTAMAVSPTGRYIASGGIDGRLNIWQQSDGSMLASIAAHKGGVCGLTWLTGADEAQICSAGRDQQIKIWDWRLEREVKSWSAHADQIRALSEVPNAKGSPRVASCGDDRVVKVWDTGSATEVCTLRGHLDRVLCVAAADGEVYSSGEDRTLRAWRIAPAGELKTFRGATDVVRSVAAAPDGSWVVSGGDDLLLRIWNTTSETGLVTAGHRRRINCVGVLASRDHSSSPLIVSGSDDETVRVWSSGSAEELTSLYGHSGPVNVVGTDPGGRWFCSGGEDGTVRLWSTRQAWSKVKSAEHAGRIACLLMDPQGKLFYSASEDHTVKIWDRSCSLITTLRGHAEAITSLALTSNNLLVSASNDNTLKVWDAATGNLLRTLGSTFDPSVVSGGMQSRGGHTGAVTCLASAGDNLVISGSKDSTVRLWNVDTGQELMKFSGARGVIENLMLTSGGKLVAFGSAPQIATWDLARGGSPELLTGHKSRVSCAATIRTNQLVTGSLDKTVQLWNLDTRESLQSFTGHSDWVTCVAISPEGDELVSGSRDGKVMLWKLKRNTSLTLVGHTESVRGVAIDAVNRRAISYADDQWLLIWDLESGEELNAVHFDSPVTSFLMVSPEEFLLGTRRGGIALIKTERSRSRSQSFTRPINNAA